VLLVSGWEEFRGVQLGGNEGGRSIGSDSAQMRVVHRNVFLGAFPA